MNITAGAYSSKGTVRAHNEDAFLIAGEAGGGGIDDTGAVFSGTAGDNCLLFFVADGMGGHAAGDVASAFVSEQMKNAARENGRFDSALLEKTVKGIHALLLEEGKKRGTPNMGTTLAGIVLQNGGCGFFNAGDSRVYRFRNGLLQQLSRDDSLSSVVPGAAKNIITNAVGAGLAETSVESRFSPSVAVAGDVFFMCSDGVHGFISDDDLELMLADCSNPAEIARLIVEKALANNSDDNCTAVVVKIEAKTPGEKEGK
jgi:serine/threonine protein phosphatase PrpC